MTRVYVCHDSSMSGTTMSFDEDKWTSDVVIVTSDVVIVTSDVVIVTSDVVIVTSDVVIVMGHG